MEASTKDALKTHRVFFFNWDGLTMRRGTQSEEAAFLSPTPCFAAQALQVR